MEQYISKLLNEVPYNMDSFAKTPAASHLFYVKMCKEICRRESIAIPQHCGKITISMQEDTTRHANYCGIYIYYSKKSR